MNIVAHQDDDLLFQSPTLIRSITAGQCVRTIYLTAGDAGGTAAYWQFRETGVEAAYAHMAGVADSWLTSDAGIAAHPIRVRTLIDKPTISLEFMRLPDGDLDGSGYPSSGHESLQKLFTGTIGTLHAIDRTTFYSLGDLRSVLLESMRMYRPTMINTLDYRGTYGDGDHSDHHTVGYLVLAAQKFYATPHWFAGYQAYRAASQPANVATRELEAKKSAFYLYGLYDYRACSSDENCDRRPEHMRLPREYTVGSPTYIP